MTKKDYELIASGIKDAFLSLKYSPETVALRRMTTDILTVKLAKDNPKFDSKKFRQACGIED